MPYETERLRLRLEVGAPILLIRRIMLSRDGQPLEATEIKAAAEEFETTTIGEAAIEHTHTSTGEQTGWPEMSPDGPIVLAL
ncbi:hypothetical protein [Nonomuraea dietziae]